MSQRAIPVLLIAAGLSGLALWRVLVRPAPVHPVAIAAIMTRLDTDGDQRLSPEEFYPRAAEGAAFELFDLDQSGHLESFELEAILLFVDPVWLTVVPG